MRQLLSKESPCRNIWEKKEGEEQTVTEDKRAFLRACLDFLRPDIVS